MSYDNIVSIHTFIFPFMWDYSSLKDIKIESYDKRVNIRAFKNTLSAKWKYVKRSSKSDTEFNEYVYYYNNVRDAIYSKSDSEEDFENGASQTVYNFKYKMNKGTYKIITPDKKIYVLDIDTIKLKIYDTGVGIISFHLHNVNSDTNQNDILNINEFGRRIYPQFISDDGKSRGIVADELCLTIDDTEIIENFRYEFNDNPCKISDTIMKLLGTEYNNGHITINPIIDDRMFTICWYGNNELFDQLKCFQKGDYCYAENDDWYKYIFIDTDYKTCKSNIMQKDLSKESTYDRWIGDGLLYGITSYSLMLLTGSGAPHYLTNHMRTIYYEMVCLTLAQRASILKFSILATQTAALKENKIAEYIKQIQKYYLKFINKIYFREVTAQNQGIEIYNMLIKAMNIERDSCELDKEINELHSYSHMIIDERKNNISLLLTVMGSLFIISSFVISIFSMSNYSDSVKQILNCLNIWEFMILTIIISAAPSLILLLVWLYRKRH